MKMIRSSRGGTFVLLLAGVSACGGTPRDPGETTQAISVAAASAGPQGVAGQGAPGKPAGARVVHRSHKDPAARTHATGRRELTPQEKERFDKTVPKVVGVQPTQEAVDRLREAGAPAPQGNIAPFGSDVVTAPAGAKSAATATATAALATLPRAVDNSTSPAFPEIRNQEGIGSCVPFAVGYYQYTYALGKLAGWNNKNTVNTTKVSPKFLYNIVNGGYDVGSAAFGIHEILSEYGAATWSDFPYSGDASNPVNYRAWPTTSTIWKNALRYKSLGGASLNSPTDPTSVAQVKSLLVNGQVLTFDTYIYSWEFEQLDNDPSTTLDDAYVGQTVATWQDGYEGSHEATIVGYNDDLWVDINANGMVDAGEKGAFKVANSWGATWANAGYVWIAYDALNFTSQVTNGPSSDTRQPLMGTVYALTGARTNYQPNLLAEMTVSSSSRGSFPLSIGMSEPDRTNEINSYYPSGLGGGGDFRYDGTAPGTVETATFDFDISDFAYSYGDLTYRLDATNYAHPAATLSSFSLTDRFKNNLKTTSTDPAATVGENEHKALTIRYKFQDPSRVPQLALTPSATSVDFGTMMLGQSTKRQLTAKNTGTGNLYITSQRFANPLFLSHEPYVIQLGPGESSTLDLEFAPASAQSETGTLSLRNTSANLPSPSLALTGAATGTDDSAPYQLFITGQGAANDNAIAFGAELRSKVTTATNLSDYQVVYYLNDPGLDLSAVVWDTYYTNVGAISVSLKPIVLGRQLGPRTADIAVTFRFAAGTTLPPGGSAIFQGSLHRADYSWYPDETDDWSRYVRRDGMAEGTIIQAIASKNIVFGVPGESQPGAYQLSFAPNPVTTQGTATFVDNNSSDVGTLMPLYFFTSAGDVQDVWYRYISATGTQTVTVDTTNYPTGQYTVVLESPDGVRLDATTFTKQ
jgi:C1A family cysteine protease